MDDDGIPNTPEDRLIVAAKIIERASMLGISTDDIVIDPSAVQRTLLPMMRAGTSPNRDHVVECQHPMDYDLLEAWK